MPDTKISGLTDGVNAVATDRIPVARSPYGANDNRYLTPDHLRAFGAFTPVYVSGRWYLPESREPIVATGLAFSAANTLRLSPFIIERTVTISELGGVVTTGEAGKNIQWGIYASSTTTALPTVRVARTASMTIDATGAKTASITGGNVTLTPGLYWGAANSDSTSVVCVAATSGGINGSALVGSTTLANILGNNVTLTGLTTPDTFGTWTADITGNTFTDLTNSRRAVIAFKVA